MRSFKDLLHLKGVDIDHGVLDEMQTEHARLVVV
jgi:hypothetical protein